MKLSFAIVMILLLCTGCGVIRGADSGTVLNGIVISKSESGLLVAAADKDSGLASFDPVSVHYEKASDLDVTLGAIVKINFDGRIAESYPGQIWADKIKVVEKVKDNWPPTASLSKDYNSENAIADNCYVIGLAGIVSEDLLYRFADNTKNGMAGYLRKVVYTIEGDPIITDLVYDGNKYFVIKDISRDAYAGNGSKLIKKEYGYINTYERDNKKVIYLSDRVTTDEEYEQFVAGDEFSDLPDIFTLNY